MNKPLLMLCLGLLSGSVSAQKIEQSGYVEPLKYEKRAGKLQILTYAKLDEKLSKIPDVQLDGNRIVLEKVSTTDSLLFWAPMVGKTSVLKLSIGKQIVANHILEAPIDSDWGYFSRGTIHIIQSSHQDIAWMNTPEYCRTERINDIITPALDMMKTDPNFTFEMEQTLNLMEYLDVHPERKAEIQQRYEEGRFAWGATYNQPYEGLLSGEQLVRQAYYGRKWICENFKGCDDLTANNIDVPGRTLQMPQILAKSGIKNLFVSRMGEGLYNWYSPDGSRVFTYTPGNYGWASIVWKYFDKNAVDAMHRLRPRVALWDAYFIKHNIPPHYAVLMSCDATKPVNFSAIIAEWNSIAALSEVPLPQLTNSTAERYFEQVNTPQTKLEEIHGERPDLWLYIHGPAHYQSIANKREAGVLLPAAEIFTSIAQQYKGNLMAYPRADFDRAWMASIYPDHGWGGKNGETTDHIFADSLKSARDQGFALLSNAFAGITSDISARQGDWVVYNDLSWDRTDVVKYKIEESNLIIRDSEGKEIATQLIDGADGRYLIFVAEQVPSIGYKSFSVSKVKSRKIYKKPESVVTGDNYYENTFYRIRLGDGGIISLFDKSLQRDVVQNEKYPMGEIIDVKYTGNGAGEFNRVQDVDVADFKLFSSKKAAWKIVNDGALATIYESRAAGTNANIVQRITLYHTIKKIDFDITLENFRGTQNRQYRILFPVDMKTTQSAINYEVPMGVAQVNRDEMKNIPMGWSWYGSYVHHSSDTHPREIQNFISSNGNGLGVTLSSCVAVADWIDPAREVAQYPVLQGILLSSHKSCHGEGNWYHQTGTHHFNFSLISHAQGWQNGYQYGVEANHPLRADIKQNKGGDLPPIHSFVTVSDPLVALTTLKKVDANERAIIIRLTEMEGKDKQVCVTLPFAAKRVIRTNLIEQEEQDLQLEGTRLMLDLGHHAIETFKIIL